MKHTGERNQQARSMVQAALAAITGLLSTQMLTGCVAVGYRSGGGWFVWPGSLGLLVLLLLLFFVLRGRR